MDEWNFAIYVSLVSSIHPSLHGLSVGVQCPLTSSLGEFQAIGTGSGVLGFCPCWCPSPFSFVFSISRCFPFTRLYLPLNFIRVSSLWLMYLHPPVDPSLTHFIGEFPGLGLALVPRCCGPRGGAIARMKPKSRFKCLPWPGI